MIKYGFPNKISKDAALTRELQGTTGSVAENRFAIVVSKYHHSITGKLLDGAIQTLKRHQVPEENIEVLWVPGAWEIVGGAQLALDSNRFDALVTLGCVIRGETTHDQHINSTVSAGIGNLSLEHKTPIGFGLLTCNTMDQAIQRAGGDVGNKGVETAEAAIHMLLLAKELNA
ncbi:MAG: 6,7-dimethyl-8-ribityllumazine synthase [Mariniblastus sp.]